MTIIISGHKNPDTDSVCAAIALSKLKNQLGENTIPGMQGPLSPESKFVLEYFSVEEPEIITDATDRKVYLVDHSDKNQSLDNIDSAEILGIVDHHKLGDITTTKPLEFWALPVGCSCTVIKGMFDYYQKTIDKKTAGLMLSAILSDTVLFKSQTTTELDKKAAEELAKIAEISDINTYGMEMFKAKSAIEGTSAEELIQRDYKDFTMSGSKIGVGQLELIDITLAENMTEDLFKELTRLKEEGRHTVMLLLTDIMKEGSRLLCITEEPEKIEEAFNTTLKNNEAWLAGVMSRKKQIIPQLEKAFS